MFNLSLATDRWMKIIIGVLIASHLGFWGGFSATAGATLAAHNSISLAVAWGMIVGAGCMAASVALTIQKQGAWKDLGIVLPRELERVLEQTDIAPPPSKEVYYK